jgi:hypothetical protein
LRGRRAQVALGGAGEPVNRVVDRLGIAGDGALGGRPAHHAADDGENDGAGEIALLNTGLGAGEQRQDEGHGAGAKGERDRPALQRQTIHPLAPHP